MESDQLTDQRAGTKLPHGWQRGERKTTGWALSGSPASSFLRAGSELKLMQSREEEMRTGGKETYPIKIIETADKTLEQTLLVNTDPFDGDETFVPSQNSKNKISCRRKDICRRISCRSCLRARRHAHVRAHLESAA